jgi:microfibrillar-associated protein 1
MIDSINIDKNVINQIESQDRRLQRLTINKDTGSNNKIEERLKARREIYQTEIIKEQNKVESRKIDNKPNREELKRKLLEQEQVNQSKADEEPDDELLELLGDEADAEQCDEEESYEEEAVLLRPVYVRKEDRLTLKTEEELENEQVKSKEELELAKQTKKEETKKLIQQYIENEANKVEIDAEDTTMPDDSDDINQEQEYEEWKIREFRRIKKALEEDEIKLKERLEIERRRNLTDEQRKEENLRLGTDETAKPVKSKLRFLQKYYHKGAYYQHEAAQDTNNIFNRDYNLPTWQDKIDRSNLPKIKQVRRGDEHKSGRTKYTHLTAEDTTNFDPKYKVPDNIVNNLVSKMGGYKAKDTFELTGRKRKNN